MPVPRAPPCRRSERTQPPSSRVEVLGFAIRIIFHASMWTVDAADVRARFLPLVLYSFLHLLGKVNSISARHRHYRVLNVLLFFPLSFPLVFFNLEAGQLSGRSSIFASAGENIDSRPDRHLTAPP